MAIAEANDDRRGGSSGTDFAAVTAPGNPAATNEGGRTAAFAYRPGYEVMAEQILRLIAELDLSPGDRMPTERELATRLGSSRTVVREAIKILSAAGRVSVQKGRGLYVADGDGGLSATGFGGFFMPMNLDHIFMLFEFRRVQEIAASRLAATRATPAELRVVEAAVHACRDGHQTGEPGRFEAADDDFHLGVAAASHNAFLVAAVREARRLQRQARVIGVVGMGGRVAEAVEEHEAIYRAIRDGQPEAAAGLTVVHLDNTLKDYRREIERRVFGGNLP